MNFLKRGKKFTTLLLFLSRNSTVLSVGYVCRNGRINRSLPLLFRSNCFYPVGFSDSLEKTILEETDVDFRARFIQCNCRVDLEHMPASSRTMAQATAERILYQCTTIHWHRIVQLAQGIPDIIPLWLTKRGSQTRSGWGSLGGVGVPPLFPLGSELRRCFQGFRSLSLNCFYEAEIWKTLNFLLELDPALSQLQPIVLGRGLFIRASLYNSPFFFFQDELFGDTLNNIWNEYNLQYLGMVFMLPRVICLFVLIFGCLTASCFVCMMRIIQSIEPKKIVSAYGEVRTPVKSTQVSGLHSTVEPRYVVFRELTWRQEWSTSVGKL